MIHCYLSPEQWGEGEVCLTGPEARHLSRVLRVSPGDEILCSDAKGREARAKILRVSAREILLSVGPARFVPEPSFRITLAVGIPGQGKLDEIISQATQLGVRRILPLITERTIVPKAAAVSDRKQDRLRRIAVEAVKQSGAGWVPEIQPACSYDAVLPQFSLYDRVLLASVQGPWEPLPLILQPACADPLILVGPEGDFSPREIEQAVQKGARRFSLGSGVLRCETACVAAISLVSYLLCHP